MDDPDSFDVTFEETAPGSSSNLFQMAEGQLCRIIDLEGKNVPVLLCYRQRVDLVDTLPVENTQLLSGTICITTERWRPAPRWRYRRPTATPSTRVARSDEPVTFMTMLNDYGMADRPRTRNTCERQEPHPRRGARARGKGRRRLRSGTRRRASVATLPTSTTTTWSTP